VCIGGVECALRAGFAAIARRGRTLDACTSVTGVFHVLKINYDKPIEVIDQTRPAHLAWLADEVAAGRLLLAGRQESGAGGVLITADISAEDAQDIIDRDPYTLAGLVSYERLSFNGGIRAPGL
jgi:uncharacterized protein YciI